MTHYQFNPCNMLIRYKQSPLPNNKSTLTHRHMQHNNQNFITSSLFFHISVSWTSSITFMNVLIVCCASVRNPYNAITYVNIFKCNVHLVIAINIFFYLILWVFFGVSFLFSIISTWSVWFCSQWKLSCLLMAGTVSKANRM